MTPAEERAILGPLTDVMRPSIGHLLDPSTEDVEILRRKKRKASTGFSLSRLGSMQDVTEVSAWLFVFARSAEVTKLAEVLEPTPFVGNHRLFGFVRPPLALGALVAEAKGDYDLVDRLEQRINSAGPLPKGVDRDHQVDWTAANRDLAGAPGPDHSVARQVDYAVHHVLALAVMRFTGPTVKWPLGRIMATIHQQVAEVRALKNIEAPPLP